MKNTKGAPTSYAAFWAAILPLLSCSISVADSKVNPREWKWPVPEKVPGTRYEATVPDTLDLAYRAEMSLNVLTEALDPDRDYEIYFHTRFRANPPYMWHERTGLPTNNPKFA